MKKTISIITGLFLSISAFAQKNYTDVNVNDFEKLISSDTVVVLDVRTSTEFSQGHLKKAIIIDYNDANHLQKAMDILNKNKRIAIYCRSGRRSSAFAYQLASQGYRVTNLYGGILAWQAQGKAVEK